MKIFRLLPAVLSAFVMLQTTSVSFADEDSKQRQYTYAWMYSDDSEMKPRGGSSTGPGVELATEPDKRWLALQEAGLSKKERDRRAILAMAGGFRASFDFIETVGFTENYEALEPYQSWGTEYVYVIADEPDFISLQHILVMFFENDEGEVDGPAVVKHWRQDWRYQDREIHVFAGNNTWKRKSFSGQVAEGHWSQSVYQVDDSPRYQAVGRWEHEDGYSSWISDTTWRPLPRREYSVRDDYQALIGTNRHTITPTGWTHEEDNLKAVLNGTGKLNSSQPYLAREAGFNRYERIINHDFSAGDQYWENTAEYWGDVREAWDTLFAEHSTVELKRRVDDKVLFMWLFEYAGELDDGKRYSKRNSQKYIAEVLQRFMVDQGVDQS